MNPKISIHNPCNEDWGKMKIGVDSRYCNHCTKDVIDFTDKTRQEILEYFLANYNKKICGRFNTSQLDFSYSDFIVTINALSQKQQNKNLAFYLLTLGTLILSGCESPSVTEGSSAQVIDTLITIEKPIKEEIEKVSKDSINTETKSIQKEDPHWVPNPISITSSQIKEYTNDYPLVLLGFGVIDGPGFFNRNLEHVETIIPYLQADVMPEYRGGLDSLMAYINSNLKYPEWEKNRKIGGTVYASFVIARSGKIKDAKIVKSVQGSKNFDKEVLRIIKGMPDWKPGLQNGQNVDVIFNLPFIFKL